MDASSATTKCRGRGLLDRRAMALALAVAFPLAFGACSRARASNATRDALVVRSDVEDVFLLTGELKAPQSDVISCPRVEGWEAQIKWLADDGA